ncbi:hypothetical protein PIIN_09829 [Serendipita indica DSM 11827]|uniref:Uncharacterized protein n=1 Tax=Serendipita indica (strain DSM 11827) TaxID=1109443 RepID=G4TWZ8_SERID|nr:hypothetical protein PIIN_09829 [Serendipita indica DSM 11827]
METADVGSIVQSCHPNHSINPSARGSLTVTSSSALSEQSASPMSLMITSSQQASPALPDHQLKVAPDRTLMSAAPDVDLRMRASLTTDPFAESPQRLGMIIESPVSISRSNRVPGFETIPDVHSSAEKSLDKQLGEVIGVANIAARRLSHADTLPRDILQRVFFSTLPTCNETQALHHLQPLRHYCTSVATGKA